MHLLQRTRSQKKKWTWWKLEDWSSFFSSRFPMYHTVLRTCVDYLKLWDYLPVTIFCSEFLSLLTTHFICTQHFIIIVLRASLMSHFFQLYLHFIITLFSLLELLRSFKVMISSSVPSNMISKVSFLVIASFQLGMFLWTNKFYFISLRKIKCYMNYV